MVSSHSSIVFSKEEVQLEYGKQIDRHVEAVVGLRKVAGVGASNLGRKVRTRYDTDVTIGGWLKVIGKTLITRRGKGCTLQGYVECHIVADGLALGEEWAIGAGRIAPAQVIGDILGDEVAFGNEGVQLVVDAHSIMLAHIELEEQGVGKLDPVGSSASLCRSLAKEKVCADGIAWLSSSLGSFEF